MDWTQVFTIIIANFAMFFWLRSEASSDRRELRGAIDALKTSTDAQINAIQGQIGAIQLEMKDFHGRLCAIEERNRK